MTSTAATGIGQVSLGEVDLVNNKEHVGGLRTPGEHGSSTVTVPTAAALSDSPQALIAGTGSDTTRSDGDHTVSLRDVMQALQETREQREQRIRNLFDLFDTCKSGYVDSSQIKKGFKALSIPSENKYATDLLLVCDSNRDGKVDFDEFKKYMDLKELELYLMFQAIDVKHNGVLHREELQAALGAAGEFSFHHHHDLVCQNSSAWIVLWVIRLSLVRITKLPTRLRRKSYSKLNHSSSTLLPVWISASV